MTIKDCIDIVDNIKPNQYTIKEKVMWLSFIDEIIINEVLKTHEGYDGRYDAFEGYSEDKLTETLIVPSPYDRLYTAYLKMKIDQENGETPRYNNSMVLYNTYMLEYRKYYNKTHMPLNRNAQRLVMPPKNVSSGLSDAEYENLKRDMTYILTEYFSDAVAPDKLYDIVNNFARNNIEMLKGRDGRDGIDGKDGDTPQKGVDYWTEEDKQEIVQEVIHEIDVPESNIEINSETASDMTEIIFDPESIVEFSAGAGYFDGTNAAIVDFKAVIEVDGVETTITKDTEGLDSFYIGGDYNYNEFDTSQVKFFGCKTLPFELEPYDDYRVQVFHIVYNGVAYYSHNFTIFLAKNYSKLATTKFVKEKVAFAGTKADVNMRNVGAPGAKYLQYIVFQSGATREVEGWDSFDGTNHNLIDFKLVTTIDGVETTLTKDTEGVTAYHIAGVYNNGKYQHIYSLPYVLSGDCSSDYIYVTYNGTEYSKYDSTTIYSALVVEDMNNIVDDKLATKTEVLELIKSNSLTQEDKQELIQDVISALPVYNGEVVL